MLTARPNVGGGALPPGEAERLDGVALDGKEWSERRGALSGSDGGFNGAHRPSSARRRTGLSDGVLGCWRSRTQAAREVRGLWARVADGALALSRLTRRAT